MSATFEIREAKPWHVGQMARLLRAEHHRALLMVGANVHKELRACYEQSMFCRAMFVDGHLGALGGVIGSNISSDGVIWLAMTDEMRKYPVAVVKEARRQLEEIMIIKRELATTLIPGDEAAKRLAIFLGFHVAHEGPGQPALSRASRRLLGRYVDVCEDRHIKIGSGFVIAMGYH